MAQPRKQIQLSVDENGALSHVNAELLAQNIAEGLTVVEAWKAVGKVNDKWDLTQRRDFEASPAFHARIATLKAEQARLMVDKIWGMPTWMVNQLFRHALATKDVKMMSEASEMRIQIAKALQAVTPKPAPEVEPEGEKRPVGKPVSKNPQATTSTSQVKEKLRLMGMKNVPEEDD